MVDQVNPVVDGVGTSTQFRRQKHAGVFCELVSFPKNISLSEQNPGEHLLLFVRAHKIVLVGNVLLYFLIFLIPYISQILISSVNANLLGGMFDFDAFFKSRWWGVILLGWFGYVLSALFQSFLSWYYNINVLTTERFVDIDIDSVFSNRVEATAITDIEDVKDTQVGIIQSLFNMGDVTVLTASGGTVFNLTNVPKAHKVRDFIMDVCIKVKGSDNKNKRDD